MIDFDQLSAFIAIAERGTVTAAARKLHRTQSAISRRLALLEDALNAQLFERRGAKLALTDGGRAFLPFAESALASVASGCEAVREQVSPDAGSVSIAIVGTLVEAPLAEALRRLPRAGHEVTVLTAPSAEVSRLVRRGEVKLGVRYLADDDDRELVCESLGVERMCVVASPNGPLDESLRWIGFPDRTTKEDLGRLLRRQLTAAGAGGVGVMAVDSLSAQKRLVEAGMGMALLPESSVRDELLRGTLVIRDMPRMTTTIDIHIAAAAQTFGAHALVAAARELHAGAVSERAPAMPRASAKARPARGRM